ncbi:FtsH protease activity modulator HflK [Nevskia ramosa]|uniref:FtsH protease activity modulator HflK n=1 Tax=Nevskia ramosa TaxID=64002 RepID=UPI003D149D39
MAWNEPGPGGRDPWNSNSGGKRGNEGPPDLDALLKRIKAKWFGRGGAGRTPGSGTPTQMPPGAAGVIVVLVLLFVAYQSFYTVEEQERAVITRFGAYAGTTEPGPHWAYWPFERVEKLPFTQVRQVTDRATMLTQDENIVDLELSVQYRVSSAEEYLFNVASPDKTLQQATKAASREVVGRSTMDFILTDGRQAVADQIKLGLQERLNDYKAGLLVTEVNLQQAQPPEQVQAAFADAIKAREDKERVQNEAEAYANDRLPRARGEAARRIAEATAYRDQTVARAQGDAARFSALVEEYQKAPQITRKRMYFDAMSEVYAGSSKVLIDIDKGNPAFYLPLEQLLKNAQKNADSQPSDFNASSSSRNSPTRNTADDAARSRDRAR